MLRIQSIPVNFPNRRSGGHTTVATVGLAVLLSLGCGAGWADEVTPSAPVKSAEAEPGSTQPDGQHASEEQYRQLIMEAGRQLQQGNPAQTLKLLEQATKMLGGRTTADILFLAAQAYYGARQPRDGDTDIGTACQGISAGRPASVGLCRHAVLNGAGRGS